ncbi:MAG: hypothetical protein WCQ21_35000, partial [Verrucomicrobiota bacterium]
FVLPFSRNLAQYPERLMSIPAYAEGPGDNHHRATTTPGRLTPAAALGAGLLVAHSYALSRTPTTRAA